ncbi:MAG: 2-oxo acid dehydrogenase subunit E2 [Xanthobacteraceae bacterium]|nr:2-oxo acid dehydrogenase subunit E2 [Xanthobacteraceae bacterium]
MKRPITMPALSDTMNNGRLVRWLKQPGDAVKSGNAVAEVETDKAVMEVEAFHDGYLAGPLAATDHELPVGETIGYIADTADEARQAGAAAVAAPAQPASRPEPAAGAATTPAPVPAAGAPKPAAAPAAAAEPALEGLSPRARARARHAEAVPAVSPPSPAAAAPVVAVAPATSDTPAPPRQAKAPAPAQATTEDHAAALRDAAVEEGPPYRIERGPSLREAVARNIAAAAATPTFRVTAQLPLDPLRALATKRGVSLTVLLARACAVAIEKHPLFNAAFTAKGLARRDRIDVGIAVDGPDSLFSPVLRDVAARPLAELAADWKVLLGKVKARRLSFSDYRGATFYLSNLGMFDVVEAFDAVVPAGASAILAVASNRAGGAHVTLSCDHRVVFGADAARFLQTLGEALAAPAKLLRLEK